MNKKIISLVLAVILMAFAGILAEPSTIASAVTIEGTQELEDKINEIDKQISANKNKLDSLKDKKESQMEYLETLEYRKNR